MSLIINPYRFAATQVTPVLDTYGSAAAAYSVRKVRTAYTGSCLRVRRSNDNTESDIGFDASGNLDESALTSFVGANSGYVTKWYDQSTNNRPAYQTTTSNQPRIVNAGTVEKVNGKVAIRHIENDKYLYLGYNTITQDLYGSDKPLSTFSVVRSESTQYAWIWNIYFIVYNPNTESNDFKEWVFSLAPRSGGTNPNKVLYSVTYNTADYYEDLVNTSSSGVITQSTQYIAQSVDSGSQVSVWVNGSSTAAIDAASSDVPWQTFDYGEGYLMGYTIGYAQEVLFYAANKSSDRTGIRDNINSYFGVY